MNLARIFLLPPRIYNPNTIKSYKNYLQNTQHMVLHNRPTLSIGTGRLACLNSPLGASWGPSPSTRQVPGFEPWPPQVRCIGFFLHPPFLLQEFFLHLPHQPRKSVRVKEGIYHGSYLAVTYGGELLYFWIFFIVKPTKQFS